MPFGRTWRDVLGDESVALESLGGAATSWNTCAVGERAALLLLNGAVHPCPWDLVDDVAARGEMWKAYVERHEAGDFTASSPGAEFMRMVLKGDRKRALEVLDIIEAVRVAV